MKYIAFIGGPVLLVAICCIVLWSAMPTAKLSVHAVRRTGTNLIAKSLRSDRKHPTDKEVQVFGLPVPFWEVSITNKGRGAAEWHPVLAEKDGKGIVLGEAIVGDFGPSGSLAPGQWTNVNIPIPAIPDATWTLAVRYDSPPSNLEKNLGLWLTHVPILNGLLPNNHPHFAYDGWHQGTNVTTAH